MSIIILQSKNIYGEDWSVARVLWGVDSSNFAGLKYSKSLQSLVSERTKPCGPVGCLHQIWT